MPKKEKKELKEESFADYGEFVAAKRVAEVTKPEVEPEVEEVNLEVEE